MEKEKYLKILEEGVNAWNEWRDENPQIKPKLIEANLSGKELDMINLNDTDLAGANLSKARLRNAKLRSSYLSEAKLDEADLSNADLSDANLVDATLIGTILIGTSFDHANFYSANLTNADLRSAYLGEASFYSANLKGANLEGADLHQADLYDAKLNNANLEEADLKWASLVGTDLRKANISNCDIYGVSVWDLRLGDTVQANLNISDEKDSVITVDNIEVAQFIYLLINNDNLRNIIDTISSKVVLILGRFTPERKYVLNKIREVLRKYNYIPVLFDFEKPARKSFVETISTLAHLAKFVIADITDAKVILQELDRIVPSLPSVPVQPLIYGSIPTITISDLMNYPWFLDIVEYKSPKNLLSSIEDKVIAPAEAKAKELDRLRKINEASLKNSRK